jgi:hypothetical protein
MDRQRGKEKDARLVIVGFVACLETEQVVTEDFLAVLCDL